MTRFQFSAAALFVVITSLFTSELSAQTSYTCFPTCDSSDGRFMALSGTDYNAFTGDTILMALGTPGNFTHVEVGIFDGESSGMWDFSAAPLEYTLFADSSGLGVGAVKLAQWVGDSLPDNRWWTYRTTSSPAAKARNGNYIYYLQIRSTDTSKKATSAFKARCNGTITIKSHQAFAIYAPLTDTNDMRAIYPVHPNLETTKYDGTWRLYLHVPKQSSFLLIWDGDMDYGSFDGAVMDADDQDTPNETIPSWAKSRNEGEAYSQWTIRDPLRPESTIKMSGDPADNNQNALYRRIEPITYEVIDPKGRAFPNPNPSGNLEWEQFRIDTAPFDADVMDYHVDTVPIGVYQIRVKGMDMGNVNSWRFFNNAAGFADLEVIGVDILGNPVLPVTAVETVAGSASGVIYYDTDRDGVQDPGEPGIPSVTVKLTSYFPDGTVKSTSLSVTDPDGRYMFPGLGAGNYNVAVDMTTLENDVAATSDADGTATPYTAAFAITATAPNQVLPFGWRRTHAPGTLTRGYWVNHPEDWPVETLMLGGVSYTKAEAI
ncbi:MAG: hypothetical protein H7X80_02770, partial [bacterium]|nr:hypothetical protein [Candidatus Kapabacteria bacterium]